MFQRSLKLSGEGSRELKEVSLNRMMKLEQGCMEQQALIFEVVPEEPIVCPVSVGCVSDNGM